tara:strand:- start:159 stop:422 length:264 start_codon:yes stop_codon:yes gene_type:complete
MSNIKDGLEWDLTQKKEELELAKSDFKDAKEAEERLKNLQKTDLNHWAQIDYQRMLPSREKQVKIYLKKVNIIEKEILEIEEKLSKL